LNLCRFGSNDFCLSLRHNLAASAS
jgi:hypothetical protein